MRKTNCYLFLAITIITSCSDTKKIYSKTAHGKAGISKIAQYTEGGTFLWAHYDASKRSSVMYLSENGELRVLAENSPDVAYQTILDINAKVKVTDEIDAEAALKTQRSVAQLGKRTAAVNMLRDALYRINEMYYASQDYKKRMADSILFSKNQLFIDQLKGTSETKNINTESFDNIILKDLYIKVLETAKEISITESNSDQKIAEAESNADIKKSELEIEKLKAIQASLNKSESKLSKEEFEALLKKILESK